MAEQGAEFDDDSQPAISATSPMDTAEGQDEEEVTIREKVSICWPWSSRYIPRMAVNVARFLV